MSDQPAQATGRGEGGDDLKACPFCGSDAVNVMTSEVLSDVPDQQTHAAFCRNCAMQGPGHLNRDCAIAAWNRRAPQPAASGPWNFPEAVALIQQGKADLGQQSTVSGGGEGAEVERLRADLARWQRLAELRAEGLDTAIEMLRELAERRV